jgi:hypothetical protein
MGACYLFPRHALKALANEAGIGMVQPHILSAAAVKAAVVG